jgi:cytochrome c peroxidase
MDGVSNPARRLRFGGIAALASALLVGVGAADDYAPSNRPASRQEGAAQPLSAVAELGRAIFYDRSLSSSGKLSCAGCHDPAHGYAPANDLPVQLGGPNLDRPGIRAVPSLGYMVMTPPFSVGPESAAEVEAPQTPATMAALAPADAPAPIAGPLAASLTGQPKAAAAAPAVVPQGGFFWDGRADTLEEQSIGPMLSPFEMDNANADAVYQKLVRAPYRSEFSRLFGPEVLADEKRLLSEATFALARYEFEEPSFHPFTSKFDYYLRGEAALSDGETRGLNIFDDPKKGGCAACHLDKIGKDGQFPVFTDYQYEALAPPRNRAIPANADPNFFDLGICGPLRSDDYAKQPENCGLFKTPTLRNVATRGAFFHNGVFHTLEDVVRFYVERNANPEKWYPRQADGTVNKFDDVPKRYWANIDFVDPPFDRKFGDPPVLDDADIADLIAFLNTLTDGYELRK